MIKFWPWVRDVFCGWVSVGLRSTTGSFVVGLLVIMNDVLVVVNDEVVVGLEVVVVVVVVVVAVVVVVVVVCCFFYVPNDLHLKFHPNRVSNN